MGRSRGDVRVTVAGFRLRVVAGLAVLAATGLTVGCTGGAQPPRPEADLASIARDWQRYAEELAWTDRVVDRHPGFALADPWVTAEFRIRDLLTQRSGLPAYAADLAGALGFEADAAIASLAHIEPVAGFRDEFAYQNVPHLVAGEIVAEIAGTQDWPDAVEQLLLEPLGMTATSARADGLDASTDTTRGHQIADGGMRVLEPARFPAGVAGAGALVSSRSSAISPRG